jgi:hypothetical protein
MRPLRPASPIHAVGVVVVVLGFLAAVARLGVDGPVQGEIAVAFAVVIAVGEAMRLTLPGGRDNAPLAATACLGFALTYRIGGHPALWTASQVVVTVAVASVLGSLPQLLAGRPPGAGYLLRRVGVTGFIAWIARTVLHAELSQASHQEIFLVFSALACLAVLLDTTLAALFALTTASRGLPTAYQPPRTPAYAQVVGATAFPGGERPTGPGPLPESFADERTPSPAQAEAARGEGLGARRRLSRFLMVWVRECTETARVCPAVAALTVAVALAAGPLGLWVLPIAAAPILVMQRALRRYAAIRATYQQTIRALSRITDLAGYTEPGHARRVCRVALAMGRELGMSEPELLDLECAALLHDLGQLSLADPLPGGATVTAPPAVAVEVAARGAEVVRQTGVLDRVALLVEAQCVPHADMAADGGHGQARVGAEGCGPGEPVRAAAVLRVANDFEDLCNAEPGPAAQLAALARIRLGEGRIYDPRAVAALARLVRTF